MLSSLFLIASLAAGALALPQPPTFSCGSDSPPEALLSQVRQLQVEALSSNSSSERNLALSIDTYVHIVTTRAASGAVTDTQLDEQMERLNAAYSPLDVSFNLVSVDRTVNNGWARGNNDAAMKAALRQGSYADLNLYYLSDLGQGLLGFCYFPTTASEGSEEFTLDGCVMLAGTVPNGDVPNYNGGATTVHEVGHWFGLFHVFQGESCSGAGDSVSDTPPQSIATRGCPTRQDSCPNSPGLDSVTNYMDYSDDACMTSFTPGQKTRLDQLWEAYREGN